MNSLQLLSPIFVLCGGAFILFGLDAAGGGPRLHKASFWMAFLTLVAALLTLVQPVASPVLFARQMLVWDGLSYFFSGITLLTLMFVVFLSESYREFSQVRLSAYYGLLMLAGVGSILLAASNDLLMVFIAVELIGIPSFVLAGYLKHRKRSAEAAIKFFLIGAFCSAMLAYGVSLIYGVTGTTSLSELMSHMNEFDLYGHVSQAGFLLILVSFGFQLALVPFHTWVPDVFEGAPTPVAAFLSVAPKMMAAAITLRVFTLALPGSSLGVLKIIAVLAAVTMTLASIAGLQQTNVKRLLGYSSISHMGFLLLGLVAPSDLGFSAIFFYAWAYLFMNLGAFAVIIAVSNSVGTDDLSGYNGLSQRSPFLAGLLAIFLLSMAGVPPLGGFMAKFLVISAAMKGGWLWLAFVAIVNTVVSAAFYFKILRAMYFGENQSYPVVAVGLPSRLTLAVTSFFTLLLGLDPRIFLSITNAFSRFPHP